MDSAVETKMIFRKPVAYQLSSNGGGHDESPFAQIQQHKQKLRFADKSHLCRFSKHR